MKKHLLITVMMAMATMTFAQQVNDNNTPLHLMKPAYRLNYGIPTTEEVKATIDRILQYIDGETPARLCDSHLFSARFCPKKVIYLIIR